MKAILKVATVKIFDREYEEWETHNLVTAIIDQGDTVILLYADGGWLMLSKMRFDINQPVWKKYSVIMEEVNNVTFKQ